MSTRSKTAAPVRETYELQVFFKTLNHTCQCSLLQSFAAYLYSFGDRWTRKVVMDQVTVSVISKAHDSPNSTNYFYL